MTLRVLLLVALTACGTANTQQGGSYDGLETGTAYPPGGPQDSSTLGADTGDPDTGENGPTRETSVATGLQESGLDSRLGSDSMGTDSPSVVVDSAADSAPVIPPTAVLCCAGLSSYDCTGIPDGGPVACNPNGSVLWQACPALAGHNADCCTPATCPGISDSLNAALVCHIGDTCTAVNTHDGGVCRGRLEVCP